jgi:G:T-mismatch repair DNA endonuclease (very short patch repair protein)
MLSEVEAPNFSYLYPMADVHSPSTRSYNMSRIKCNDTKSEMLVEKYLFKKLFLITSFIKNLQEK